jgi:hypothetical protein
MDTDLDGSISFEEFSAACAAAAQVHGVARPGVVQTHASCAGTNACRGMILHPWNELFEHDCRGVNSCAGWSCVETATDQGRDGAAAFEGAQCTACHAGSNGNFLVLVPVGSDVDAAVAGFFDKTDERMRSAIAFGFAGLDANGVATANMPSHYEQLSRREIDTLVAHLRTLGLEGATFE